jgi:hypothetical protein
MQRSAPILVAIALVAGLSSSARAQFPYSGPPLLEGGKLPECTASYRKSVESQISTLEKFRTAGPAFVGQICSLIEGGSALLGGELPDDVRAQIKSVLGVDVDLRFIKTQCRVSQGNLDRELITQLGTLHAELIRCDNTI